MFVRSPEMVLDGSVDCPEMDDKNANDSEGMEMDDRDANDSEGMKMDDSDASESEGMEI